jgi:DNA-binding transcriptional LysR family regulator
MYCHLSASIDKLAIRIINFKKILKIRQLQDLEIFVTAADNGGLSAAARQLGISPAVASAALKRLESDLHTALFVRTTRSIRLTLAGERFLARCRTLLEGLREAEEELALGHARVQGSLQISMPSDLGRNVLLPWLDTFQMRYPAVHLHLQTSDRIADIYRQPVDIAIRYGRPPDSGLVALPLLTENRRVLCASPAYLALHGEPASPHALADHNCLCFMLDEALYDRWRFWKNDKETTVSVRGNRVTDDSDLVRRWAVAGHGIAYRARLDVAQDIADGRLRIVCPDWTGENVPLTFVCADRRQLSPAVRLLRDFLQERCREVLDTTVG